MELYLRRENLIVGHSVSICQPLSLSLSLSLSRSRPLSLSLSLSLSLFLSVSLFISLFHSDVYRCNALEWNLFDLQKCDRISVCVSSPNCDITSESILWRWISVTCTPLKSDTQTHRHKHTHKHTHTHTCTRFLLRFIERDSTLVLKFFDTRTLLDHQTRTLESNL